MKKRGGQIGRRRADRKRYPYEPRLVGGKLMMPSDLQRLHRSILTEAAYLPCAGGGAAFRSRARAVTSCAGAKGFANRTLPEKVPSRGENQKGPLRNSKGTSGMERGQYPKMGRPSTSARKTEKMKTVDQVRAAS
jgi:hypothetical protein